MTIVYISRHSQPFRKLLGEYKVNEIEQIRNEKNRMPKGRRSDIKTKKNKAMRKVIK